MPYSKKGILLNKELVDDTSGMGTVGTGLLFEVAKSGRMRCRECGCRIEKGSVRVRVDACTCRHLCCSGDLIGEEKVAEILDDVC